MLTGWSLVAAVTLGLSQEAVGPRNWTTEDPEVRFVEGTTSPSIDTLGTWSGRVAISIRCSVEADGSLDACVVVEESAQRRLSHRSARVNVGKMGLELREEGPRPGDTLTVNVVVTTH